MADNYIQKGDVVELTAPTGGVISGNGYLIDSVFVVALTSAAQGEKFNGKRVGVWTLPKPSTQVWAEGVKLYWNDTAKNVTATATNNTLIGAAAAEATNPSTTGSVLLTGQVV